MGKTFINREARRCGQKRVTSILTKLEMEAVTLETTMKEYGSETFLVDCTLQKYLARLRHKKRVIKTKKPVHRQVHIKLSNSRNGAVTAIGKKLLNSMVAEIEQKEGCRPKAA